MEPEGLQWIELYQLVISDPMAVDSRPGQIHDNFPWVQRCVNFGSRRALNMVCCGAFVPSFHDTKHIVDFSPLNSHGHAMNFTNTAPTSLSRHLMVTFVAFVQLFIANAWDF
jgi:hypothetical protein